METFIACSSCQTGKFCSDIGRCLEVGIIKKFGEADIDDAEDELAADTESGLRRNIFFESRDDELSRDVIKFIKRVIKS